MINYPESLSQNPRVKLNFPHKSFKSFCNFTWIWLNEPRWRTRAHAHTPTHTHTQPAGECFVNTVKVWFSIRTKAARFRLFPAVTHHFLRNRRLGGETEEPRRTVCALFWTAEDETTHFKQRDGNNNNNNKHEFVRLQFQTAQHGPQEQLETGFGESELPKRLVPRWERLPGGSPGRGRRLRLHLHLLQDLRARRGAPGTEDGSQHGGQRRGGREVRAEESTCHNDIVLKRNPETHLGKFGS